MYLQTLRISLEIYAINQKNVILMSSIKLYPRQNKSIKYFALCVYTCNNRFELNLKRAFFEIFSLFIIRN